MKNETKNKTIKNEKERISSGTFVGEHYIKVIPCGYHLENEGDPEYIQAQSIKYITVGEYFDGYRIVYTLSDREDDDNEIVAHKLYKNKKEAEKVAESIIMKLPKPNSKKVSIKNTNINDNFALSI